MVIAGINSQIDKITGIVNIVDKGAARYFFKHIAGKVSNMRRRSRNSARNIFLKTRASDCLKSGMRCR
jgi:hypothetical protein